MGLDTGAREDGGSAQQGLPAHMKAVVFRLWVSVTLGRNWPHSDLPLHWEREDTARLHAPSWEAVEKAVTREEAGSRNPSLPPGSLGASMGRGVQPPGETTRTE